MLVSLKWLRKYVDSPLTSEELVDRLTMVGLEVEGVEQRKPSLPHVITARLLSVRSHPRAERLHLCEVSTGEQTLRIVCGASNLVPNSVVPLALPGAQLPNGAVIEEASIRGELSRGMLCSRRELGLGDDADGIWLLPAETPVGVTLQEALGGEDTILDVSVTPNRSDCLSMIGMAREVAAICGKTLTYPTITLEENGAAVDSLGAVTIEDAVRCPRYAARILEGVTIGPSPAWLCECLEAVGLRSINNIVDVTNYVLMEMGQPLHAFDFDQLAEHRIVVRTAVAGERFTTLDGLQRTLVDDALLICDGRKPVAIAGIMGGLESEITPSTTRVLIESAYFQPQCIRRTSKKLGLRTESSYRFERSVDPEGLIRALDRAAQLMLEVGGGRLAKGRIDVYPDPFIPPTISVRVDRANRFLGTSFSAAEIAGILRGIEIEVSSEENGQLLVNAPTFRQDISREVDVFEEIARRAGYNNILSTYPEASIYVPAPDSHLLNRGRVRSALTGFGLFEVINYSFISMQSLLHLGLPPEDRRTQPIRVQNPLTEEQAVLRTSLIPGLALTAQRNLDRRNENLRFFELSKVFLPANRELPEERYQLSGLMTGLRIPQQLYGGDEKVDYTDVKGIVEAVLSLFNLHNCQFRREQLEPYVDPWDAASVYRGEKRIGTLGRLHPEVAMCFDFNGPVYIFELDFDLLHQLQEVRPFYRQLPRFPAVVRDMALVVAEQLAVREPLDFILAQQDALLEQVEMFDLYRNEQLGEGRKSVGYRLVYRAQDRSLTDEEVNAMHENLTQSVIRAFQATLR
jgi:phenylalanyl-tRNA synthetase beta chain